MTRTCSGDFKICNMTRRRSTVMHGVPLCVKEDSSTVMHGVFLYMIKDCMQMNALNWLKWE
jgi:hypothetical protein